MRAKRLKSGDRDLAKQLFASMAEIFAEDSECCRSPFLVIPRSLHLG
jgi:hypothetical protein